MLKTALQSDIASICQNRFERILSPICRYDRPRLGLAISGGVDSMALASLCSELRISGGKKPSFTALVVDHGLRRGSATEASKVALLLDKMEIDCHVLKLTWPGIRDPSRLPNLEMVARRLRFQILGRACHSLNIDSLLLAHHGDDQAETLMTRMIGGYLGLGLRGIQAEANIPECHGIYGASESGEPRILETQLQSARVEDGGVTVHRPLLEFSKNELIATCQQRGVKWFEDITNADKTLTVRNTIRHLFKNDAFPLALSQVSLRKVAETKDKLYQSSSEAAEAIFDDCHITLDTCSSVVTVRFPSEIIHRLCSEESDGQSADYTAAMLMRRLLMLADNDSKLSLKDMYKVARLVFPFTFENGDEPTETTVSVGNLAIRRVTQSSEEGKSQSPASHTYQIYPRPYSDRKESVKILVDPAEQRDASVDFVWSQKLLFAGRYWLRIRYRPFNFTPGRILFVRFMKKGDIQSIRADYDKLRKSTSQDKGHSFEDLIKRHAPGEIRFALPVIVEESIITNRDGNQAVQEVVCAIPSLGWSRPGWQEWTGWDRSDCSWFFECTYKKLEFGSGRNHFIKSSSSSIPQDVNNGQNLRLLRGMRQQV